MAALETGVRVPLEQAHDLTGYRAPRKDLAYLAMMQSSAEAGTLAAAPWLSGAARPPDDLAIQPEVARDVEGANATPAASAW